MTKIEKLLRDSNLNKAKRLITTRVVGVQQKKYALAYLLWRAEEPGAPEPIGKFYGLDVNQTDYIRSRVQGFHQSDLEYLIALQEKAS